MARKSYALLVAILVTFILLDCFTECGAAKNKGKGKERKKGQFREDSPASPDIPKCVFAEQVNFICGSDGGVYANAKSLECGKLLNRALKEADPSNCSTFPKTDEEKKKLKAEWQGIIKEITEMKLGLPATTRRKDKNKGNKTNRNDTNKNDKDDKKKKQKG